MTSSFEHIFSTGSRFFHLKMKILGKQKKIFDVLQASFGAFWEPSLAHLYSTVPLIMNASILHVSACSVICQHQIKKTIQTSDEYPAHMVF